MEGLIKLSENILCMKDVLGLVHDATISGIPITIHFPQKTLLDLEETSAKTRFYLSPPEIAKTWRLNNLSWGSSNQSTYDYCEVQLLAISITCTEEDKEKTACAIFRSCDQWIKSFTNYIRLLTKQNTSRNRNITHKKSCHLEFKDGNLFPTSLCTMYLTVPHPETFATKDQIIDAMQYASSGKDLFLEYQMLLSAYCARVSCHNRQAIIDACSAVELILDNNISQHIQSLNMDPSFFLQKYNSLGSKFDLIQQLDNSFPKKDWKGLIVKPRNDVAHNRDAYPTDEITDQLIACVEECMEHYYEGYY